VWRIRDVHPSSRTLIFTKRYGSNFTTLFRQYITSKPWKYGILYRSLNDAEVAYTYQAGFWFRIRIRYFQLKIWNLKTGWIRIRSKSMRIRNPELPGTCGCWKASRRTHWALRPGLSYGDHYLLGGLHCPGKQCKRLQPDHWQVGYNNFNSMKFGIFCRVSNTYRYWFYADPDPAFFLIADPEHCFWYLFYLWINKLGNINICSNHDTKVKFVVPFLQGVFRLWPHTENRISVWDDSRGHNLC
jgi:hypothetical protein